MTKRKKTQKRKANHRPDSFTVGELTTRLSIPAKVLRIAIANGTIECDQQPPGQPQPWAPVISRDAAVQFCVAIGLNPMRVMI